MIVANPPTGHGSREFLTACAVWRALPPNDFQPVWFPSPPGLHRIREPSCRWPGPGHATRPLFACLCLQRIDMQRSFLIAVSSISRTPGRAVVAAEHAPREPGPGETNLIFVSREPSRLRAFAPRERGPGLGTGIQTSLACIPGCWAA